SNAIPRSRQPPAVEAYNRRAPERRVSGAPPGRATAEEAISPVRPAYGPTRGQPGQPAHGSASPADARAAARGLAVLQPVRTAAWRRTSAPFAAVGAPPPPPSQPLSVPEILRRSAPGSPPPS